jgi:hypothetical protein
LAYYKITLAVESRALEATLDRLAIGIREGVVSKSFVVEREPESIAPEPPAERPARIKADTPKVKKRRHSAKGSAQFDAIVEYARAHPGPFGYADAGRALAAKGLSKAGVGSALKRIIERDLVRKVERGYELVETPSG